MTTNPYRHDHEPLNSDFHGGVCPACEQERTPKWTDYDMHQAWEAGAQWACDRAEIEDGELFVPTDEPGVEGRDWADECGHWLNDYELETEELRED